MTSKEKGRTGVKLFVRSGGFALSLPVTLFLGLILALLNIVMGTVIIGTIFDIGGTQALIQPVLGFVIGIFGLGMLTFFALIAATIRYVGGIRQLWKRLRGLQEEQSRIDRLISNVDVGQNESDFSEFSQDVEVTQKQQEQ